MAARGDIAKYNDMEADDQGEDFPDIGTSRMLMGLFWYDVARRLVGSWFMEMCSESRLTRRHDKFL